MPKTRRVEDRRALVSCPTASRASPTPGVRFFRELARNQRREWWDEHRAEYDTGWLAPMRALLDEVRERIEADFPQQPLAAPKVFRILSATCWFSKDKSPYKTHIGG